MAVSHKMEILLSSCGRCGSVGFCFRACKSEERSFQ